MAQFTVTAPDGKKYTVNGPEGATEADAIAEAQRQLGHQPMSKFESFTTGVMNPVYGAAQLGARMPPGGTEVPDIRTPEQYEADVGGIDKVVREREAYKEAHRRVPKGEVDWYQAAGAIPSTALLTSPLMAMPGAGPIIGGAAMGAAGGALEPAANFAEEKPGQIAWGAALGTAFGAGGKVLSSALSTAGRYIAREFPQNLMTQATQRIGRFFAKDEKSAAEVLAELDRGLASGKPMMLVDYAGQNVRDYGGTLTRGAQSKAKDFAVGELNERQAQAAQRLRSDLGRFVHPDQSVLQTAEQIQARRLAQSAEPYRLAMDPARVVDSEYIRRVLADPRVRGSIKQGLEEQRLEALGAREPFTGGDAAQYLVMDEAGNITGIRGTPNMRVLDAVKKGLDAIIQEQRNEITGKLSPYGRTIDKVRREFLTEIDQLNPDYARARAIWSGHSGSLDAMRAGQFALKNSPEEIAAEFAGLAEGDQELYRLGIASHLREVLEKAQRPEGLEGTAARNQANGLLNSEWMRRQLAPIFRSQREFEAYMNNVNNEHRAFATRSELIKGSQTQARAAEDAAPEHKWVQQAAEVAHGVATGHFNWLRVPFQVYRAWQDRLAAGGREADKEVSNVAARILFGGPVEPEVAQRLLGTYRGVTEVNPLRPFATAAERAAKQLAAGGGTVLGQDASPLH